MDIEYYEKLMPQSSEPIAVKRNIWNQLGLDTQLDVFQCLRAYDLYKNGKFVSQQWSNVIERHREMLPKIRKQPDWRVQNRLAGDNYLEIWQQRVEESRKRMEFREKYRKIREKRIKNYALLTTISFIIAIATQPISIERISAMLLLLAVSLGMGTTYAKFFYDPYKLKQDYYNCGNNIYGGRYDVQIFCKWYSTEKLDFLRYVWLGYLGTRTTVFVIIGISRHIITVDNIFDAVLWISFLPEAAYLINWIFNVCAFQINSFSTSERGKAPQPRWAVALY
ncbi:hypothetical protein Ddc_17219 [Ditylenchus destructor]|nr:hypothetical protein Ddc_17219 [Ditylenchus destructor]